MAKTLALIFLAIGSPLMLLTFLLPVPAGDGIFALLAVTYPVALIALGAQRAGRLGRLAIPLAFLLGLLIAAAVAMLMLRGRVHDGPWLGGLPAAAAVQIYGLFLLPLLLVGIAYALSFPNFLRQQDLAALRRRFAVNRHGED